MNRPSLVTHLFRRLWQLCLVLVCSVGVVHHAAAAEAVEAPPLRFGVPPWQKDLSIDDIRSHYRPILAELETKLGRKMVIVGAKDYAEITQWLADGKIELGSISPAPYVLAKK